MDGANDVHPTSRYDNQLYCIQGMALTSLRENLQMKQPCWIDAEAPFSMIILLLKRKAGCVTHGGATMQECSSGYPKRTGKAFGGRETPLSCIPLSQKLISVALLMAITGQSVV